MLFSRYSSVPLHCLRCRSVVLSLNISWWHVFTHLHRLLWEPEISVSLNVNSRLTLFSCSPVMELNDGHWSLSADRFGVTVKVTFNILQRMEQRTLTQVTDFTAVWRDSNSDVCSSKPSLYSIWEVNRALYLQLVILGASWPMTFDPPLRALWSDPSVCPQAGNRVWCWPAGGVVSGPPTAGSPAHEGQQQQIWLHQKHPIRSRFLGDCVRSKTEIKRTRLGGGLEVKRESWLHGTEKFRLSCWFYVRFFLFTQEDFGRVHRLKDVTWSPFIVGKPDSDTGGFTVSPPKPFKICANIE